jgi:hypothetical protein
MARSFDPGPDRDRRIKQVCRERGCTLTSLVNDAIDVFLDLDDIDEMKSTRATEPVKPIPKGRLVSREPYDIYNETTGCISRYKGNGELMFHFKPIEKKDGRQYYRDTLGNNPVGHFACIFLLLSMRAQLKQFIEEIDNRESVFFSHETKAISSSYLLTRLVGHSYPSSRLYLLKFLFSIRSSAESHTAITLGTQLVLCC